MLPYRTFCHRKISVVYVVPARPEQCYGYDIQKKTVHAIGVRFYQSLWVKQKSEYEESGSGDFA